MFVIIGYIVVLGAIFGGYALAGGHLGALWQPLEVLMIGGGALGAFIVGNNAKALKATFKALPSVFKGSKFTKSLYAFQIENLMDNEIETHHMEGHVPVHCIARVGDALPAFGIIAAVMGVVHTMENVALPPAELGILIAHALVGTFLGILLAYGFITPLSGLLEQKLEESTKMYQTVKVTLLASLNGYAPAIAVEFGRKVLYSSERPGFNELEDFVKQAKSR